MKVRTRKPWMSGNGVEQELCDVLTPDCSSNEGGAVERAEELSRETAATLGRLMERLVEKGTLTLEEACDLCEVYDDVEKAD